MDYEVIVIGGGPGGYVAAIKAAQLGKKTCLIEKDLVGGTCLNVGCVPTKVLLKSIGVLNDVRTAASYGITGLGQAEARLDPELLQARKKRIVNSLVSGVDGLLRKNKVTKYSGQASFIDAHTVKVGQEIISAENIIIATGSKARILSLDNPCQLPVYTSTDILEMTSYPSEMVVMGGGAIGVELAYYLSNVGVKIHIIEFLDRILPMVDRDITEKVTKRFQQQGVKIYTSAEVTGFGQQSVSFVNDDTEMELKCDGVLMSVGRVANYEGLNIEAAGIVVEKGAIVTDKYLRTSSPHIYAIGDVNGKSMLAHTASTEGLVAAEHICGVDRAMNYEGIPSCVYIAPEIASVGLTEEQARAQYGEVKVGVFPMMANSKAWIENEESGLVKVIVRPGNQEIIGVHLYCPHATDMISEMALAMNLKCAVQKVANTVHPHPTISEAVAEACHAAFSKAIHC